MRKLWSRRIAPYINDEIRRLMLAGVLFSILFLGLGLGWGSILAGMAAIIVHPSQLISDYVVVAGPGAALVNAALVGLLGLTLLTVLKVTITGPTTAAVFIMTGFGLFGKNIFNILPIFFGVWLFALYEGVSFRKYILPALFGSAMGPIVSLTAFGTGFGLAAAILAGVAAGFVISPLAAHLLRNHQGLNLYNLGFSAGFIGIFFAALLRGLNNEVPAVMIWDRQHTPLFSGLLLVLCLAMIFSGLLLNKGKFSGYRELLRHPGTLVTDFMTLAGFGPTLINMGFVGLMGIGYLLLVGGDVNGPTAGGVLTMIGFGAFGKHPRNIWPLMLGVWLGTMIFHWSAASAGALLAALFATAMAPISMQFGWPVGILAGFLHLTVAHNVGVIHGGLNLYNNGFSAGLVATAIVAIHRGLKNDD